MQFIYLINREDVRYALWGVPRFKSSVLPFSFFLMLPALQFTCFPFFGLCVTDILDIFEGCDGGAVIEVIPIARDFLSL